MKIAIRGIFLLLLLISTGCGPGNTVRLLPPPPLEASSLPPPTAPSISVVNFADDRLDPAAIGVRSDGSAFTTSNDVAMWISRALADELARKGFRVTYALTASQARAANPDYLVTGKVSEVWLKENSRFEMTAQMKITCNLANRKGKLWEESCTASQSRSGLPSGAGADNLLLDSLEDLLAPIVRKIQATSENAK